MNETIAEAEPYVPKVNPLQKIVQQVNSSIVDSSDRENTAFNNQGYFTGAFVDIMQQSRYAQSLKSKEYAKDWHHHKNTDDFEWSSDQINTLLEFYAEYPQLWDTKHEKYMNKDIRKQLISQLSEKIGAPEHAVNVKFQRLRVHFSRELRKEESSALELHPYQSKWKYYNKMLFLKDTLKCRQKIRQSNSEREHQDIVNIVYNASSNNNSSHGGNSNTNSISNTSSAAAGIPLLPTTTSTTAASSCCTNSDSGHSSPDCETVSPVTTASLPHHCSPSKETKSPNVSPLSPSLINAPFSSVSSTLVPPLLRNNNLFPTPPAFLSSIEHLLSPNVLGPMMLNTKKDSNSPTLSNILKPQAPILAPTPQIPTPQVPTSPLTPNVVCSVSSFWNSPHVLTSSKLGVRHHSSATEDEDIAIRSYQSKRQKVKEEADKAREKIGANIEERMQTDHITDCDYFSMHVSEALRKMDIIVREECKRAIQNTICQYIVKSCSKQSVFNPAGIPGLLNGSIAHPTPRLSNRKT